MEIVAATRNPAKLVELQRLVGDGRLVASLPHDISLESDGEEAIEAGEEVRENAVAKAVARTRRFAGPEATDIERARRLLELTRDLRGDERRIGWVEAVAVARDGVVLGGWQAEGEPGLLAETVDEAAVAAGGGFWVPAMWRCPAYGGRLLAELTPEERAGVQDHWAKLAGPVRAWLAGYAGSASRS